MRKQTDAVNNMAEASSPPYPWWRTTLLGLIVFADVTIVTLSAPAGLLIPALIAFAHAALFFSVHSHAHGARLGPLVWN